MYKSYKQTKAAFLVPALLAVMAGMLYAQDTLKAPASQEGDWIIAERGRAGAFDFTGYSFDTATRFSIDGTTATLDKPVLKKDEDIWIPIEQVLSVMKIMFLKENEERFTIIRDDGTPLECRVGDPIVKMNKTPFLTLSQAPRLHSGILYVSRDSLDKLLDIPPSSYNKETNIIEITKTKFEEFATFSMPKPPPSPEELAAQRPLEIKPLPPPDIIEELLPPKYQREVDLKLDTTVSYLEDKFAHDRTRQADWYLSGRAYDYTLDGHFRMRDSRGMNKQRFKEDGEFLGIYGKYLQFKLLDVYYTVPQLRSQSQSYWGTEAKALHGPFKSTYIWGNTQNTVAGPAAIGAVRYDGKLYGFQEEYKDTNNLFKVSGTVLVHENEAETQAKSSTTNYPRRNVVYILDSTTYLHPNLTLFYTQALSNYMPDNKVNKRFVDGDWRVGANFEDKLFSFKTSYERVGQQYASIGIPSTYQDFEGWDFSTTYKFAPNLFTTLSGRLNRNNIERNPRATTTFEKSLAATTGLVLPWQQNFGFTYSVTESIIRGGDQDQNGNKYTDFRFDYSKMWGNLTAQFTYDHYILEASGTATGTQLTDLLAVTFFQFYPTFNNSYLRFYQDIRKSKTDSAASYTTTLLTTSMGGRLNLAEYLSVSGEARIATTMREAFQDTAMVNLIFGGEYKSSPDTIWNIDYSLNTYDLYYSKNQTTKHYTVLFKGRHIFGINTPDKWGKVRACVYRDLNSNGKHDDWEPGINNVRVNIVKGRAVTTNAKGIALISKVVPGDRKVKVDLSGLPLDMAVRGATPIIAVEVKPLKVFDVEFPIVATGRIRGRVYVDVNKNNVYEKSIDDALPNMRVYLEPSGKETLTFSDGTYYFDYVYPGDHAVCIDLETAPADYKISSPVKMQVSLKESETLNDMNFVFAPKPIAVERFNNE